MPQAPISAGVSNTSQIGSLLAGGSPGQGADQVRQQIEMLAGQVRDLGQQVDAIAVDFPGAAQEVSSIKTLLKQIVIKASSQAPMATASGSAVPTGTSMGAPPQ